MDDLGDYLDGLSDLPCAPLLATLVAQVQGLDTELRPEIGAFGVRFRLGERLLVELTVFGDLFIARVGPQQAVEYRVRSADVAWTALDHVLREYVALRTAAAPS